MRNEGTTLDDRCSAVAPPLVCNHPDDVAEVSVIGDFRIFVRFHHGTSGAVDLSRLIESPNAGIFAELREPGVIDRASVVLGAVTWPGEIDIAPDAMYAALRRDGEWTIE